MLGRASAAANADGDSIVCVSNTATDSAATVAAACLPAAGHKRPEPDGVGAWNGFMSRPQILVCACTLRDSLAHVTAVWHTKIDQRDRSGNAFDGPAAANSRNRSRFDCRRRDFHSQFPAETRPPPNWSACPPSTAPKRRAGWMICSRPAPSSHDSSGVTIKRHLPTSERCSRLLWIESSS